MTHHAGVRAEDAAMIAKLQADVIGRDVIITALRADVAARDKTIVEHVASSALCSHELGTFRAAHSAEMQRLMSDTEAARLKALDVAQDAHDRMTAQHKAELNALALAIQHSNEKAAQSKEHAAGLLSVALACANNK